MIGLPIDVGVLPRPSFFSKSSDGGIRDVMLFSPPATLPSAGSFFARTQLSYSWFIYCPPAHTGEESLLNVVVLF